MAFGSRVVSKRASKKIPYPYVHVQWNGVVFELDEHDREYLETPFDPCDGGRPAVKSKYSTKNASGSMGGFCLRRTIPKDVPILPSPTEGRTDLDELERGLAIARAAGATIVDNGIGGYKITYPET